MSSSPTETYRPAFPPKDPKDPKSPNSKSNTSHNPYISYGLPFPIACSRHIDQTFKASRVYVIVSKSISTTENFGRLEKELGDRVAGVRKGIRPHTPWDDVIEVVEDMKAKKADIIVTLGAGSLTDGAKVISWALANDVSNVDGLSDLLKNKDNARPCEIPIINIPTSLSGGEYNQFGGATDTRTNQKQSFNHPSMGTSLIILDPALSISTPEKIWLSTGMRAVDHCVEGICSFYATAESDEEASKGLRLLVPNLLITNKDWENEEARLKEMFGVIHSLVGTQYGVPMGGSHGIGHQLGPLGVGHGETSCVMLPAVLKWTLKEGDQKVRERQQKVLDVLWDEKAVVEVLERRGLVKGEADLGDVVDAVVRELGMPRSLKEVGVGRDQLDALAVNCLKDRWLPTNPVPITTKEQVLSILEMVVGEE